MTVRKEKVKDLQTIQEHPDPSSEKFYLEQHKSPGRIEDSWDMVKWSNIFVGSPLGGEKMWNGKELNSFQRAE